MLRSFLSIITLLSLRLSVLAQSISDSDGYTGYHLSIREDGEPTAVLYETANTQPNVSDSVPEPDVFLNASVSVGEIDIEVQNLTAKINLDAQVLKLLSFNAGVDLGIDRVRLLIQNVSAKVLLEARLENLVLMINDTLSSIDLNPVIATLGQDVGNLVNTTVGTLSGGNTGTEGSNLGTRDLLSYELEHNILYSVNDYSGNTHTNRILAQDGNIVEQRLDNDGNVQLRTVVGNYAKDMTFNGFNRTVTRNGQQVEELEYVYQPFIGLSAVAVIFINEAGAVVGTQLLSESGGGGTSTIGNN